MPFYKKPEWYIPIIIAIILTIVFGGKYLININTLNQENSPGSIATIGQYGNNLVINTEKPDRHFNGKDVIEIEKFLPENKDTLIQVWYLMGDAEAKQYASEIKSYLESQRWNVDSFLGSFQWFEPVVGVHVKNISGTIRFEVGRKP